MGEWRVLDAYFRDHFYPFTKHHLDSYREFIRAKIPDVIKSFNPFTMIKPDVTVHVYIGGISGTEIFLDRPTMTGPDGKPVLMTPHEARLRNLTYETRLYANVTIKYLKSGGGVETKNFPYTPIGAVPIMLHSEMCLLHGQGFNVLKDLGECPYDQGGYFVVDGKEKVVISQERNTTNRLFVELSKEIDFSYIGLVRCTSERGETALSTRTVMFFVVNKDMPSDIPDNKRELMEVDVKRVRTEYRNQADAIYVTIPSIGGKIPLTTLFRALGVESDRAIIELVFGLIDDDDDDDSENKKSKREVELSKKEKKEKRERRDARDAFIAFLRPTIVNNGGIYSQEEALEDFRNRTTYKNSEYVKNVMAVDLFPNMGSAFPAKARFLGDLVRQLVMVTLGVKQVTNRDAYSLKRIDLSGVLMSELFQDAYVAFRNKCRDTLDNQYLYGPWKHTNQVEELVRPDNIGKIVVSSIIENSMRRALKGAWGVEDADDDEESKVQDLARLSYVGFLSHLRRANNPLDRTIKIVGPHKLNAQQWGVMCPWESPDGASVGYLKNFSLLCHITFGCESQPLRQCLDDLGGIRLTLVGSAIRGLVRIYLNGEFYGYHDDPCLLVTMLRLYKRNALINIFTSISWNIAESEIRVLSEAGRCARPLFIVEGGKIPFYEKTDKSKTDYSWFDLVIGQTLATSEREEGRYYDCRYRPPESIEAFAAMSRSKIVETLKANQSVIEYLDIEEANTRLIAMTPTVVSGAHTHCEIHPSTVFSVVSGNIPFADHNQAPRNVFHCAQSKQAIGIYATNFNKRFDTMSYILHYPQRPLISTRSAHYTSSAKLPFGTNAIVAIASYSGLNQEDAVIINRAAIDRGFFQLTAFKSVVAKEEVGISDKTVFANPKTLKESGQAIEGGKHANYNLLDANGIIRAESHIPAGQKAAVIGMCKIAYEQETVQQGMFSKTVTKEVYRDVSKFSDIALYGTVDRVFHAGDVCKVRFRKVKRPELGDKTCSFHGQKGVVGAILPPEQMPFTKDGIIPDLIINPHAFPSRMTIGHLIETIFSKVCCLEGMLGDGTVFLPFDLNVVSDKLESHQFEKWGNEIMYDGRSGLQMPCEIFLGPTYYLRLKHMVGDKMNSRGTGTQVLRTHQPTAGRAAGGGLRIGEMERDVILCYGLSQFAKESMMERSDKYRYGVCRHCGTLALFNPANGLSICQCCESNDVAVIETPYTLKLLVQELEALGITLRMSTEAFAPDDGDSDGDNGDNGDNGDMYGGSAGDDSNSVDVDSVDETGEAETGEVAETGEESVNEAGETGETNVNSVDADSADVDSVNEAGEESVNADSVSADSVNADSVSEKQEAEVNNILSNLSIESAGGSTKEFNYLEGISGGQQTENILTLADSLRNIPIDNVGGTLVNVANGMVAATDSAVATVATVPTGMVAATDATELSEAPKVEPTNFQTQPVIGETTIPNDVNAVNAVNAGNAGNATNGMVAMVAPKLATLFVGGLTRRDANVGGSSTAKAANSDIKVINISPDDMKNNPE